MFFVQSVVTCGALVWLLHRAWQTLLKPVPELISILGVEVPDAPEVTLARIKADAITIHWTRPGVNKPVVQYLIQVNGVNVGESSRSETAITVSGLKPGHFYNIRVIAVGSNNFQAGSRVIRLRTYGRNGRPQLGSGRAPSNLAIDESHSDSGDESATGRSHGVTTEAVISEGSAPMVREASITHSTHSGQRRNTGGRKHSPSNPASGAAALASLPSDQPEESTQQLTEKLKAIQRDIEQVGTQIARDAEDFTSQMEDLSKERDEKRKALKEKEEASEKLKREVNNSDRINRQTQQRKIQKEKTLRDKQNERAKMQADAARWVREIEDMKVEREEWQQAKEKLAAEKATKADELRDTIRKRQSSVDNLEQEIRLKGLQIKELEEERRNLSGAPDDEESRANDASDFQQSIAWQKTEQELLSQINSASLHLEHMSNQLATAQVMFGAVNSRISNSPLVYHGNSSSIDFEPNGQGKAKSRRNRNRKSRNGTMSSPTSCYATTEYPHQHNAYSILNNSASPTFAPGPYIDLSKTAMVPLQEQMSGMSEAEVLAMTAGAPLSPSATSYLPSSLLADDDLPNPPANPFGPSLFGTIGQSSFNRDPQSPASSSRSASASFISSPRTSSQSLAMYGVASQDHAIDNDRKALTSPRTEFGAIGSSRSPDPSATNKLTSLFSFSKSRPKTGSQESPALGSLKSTQSQSFPRSTEEPEAATSRQRRVSFSSGWNVFNRNSAVSDAPEGNAPAPARNSTARRRRPFKMFGSSIDDPSLSDRDPSSPRPVSIASSDLPRPSTDSAPFGWPAAEGSIVNRNSPLATNWSVNIAPSWSRNPSRRTSIQHISGNTFASRVASDDDEILLPGQLMGQTSSPPVGVIGTRPTSSQKPVTPKLNPAAPTFFGRFSKSDKGKENEMCDGNESATEVPPDAAQQRPISSPSDSRTSRDTHSVHTQNSIAESSESLDRTASNSTSDMLSSSIPKEKESSFSKLLRKGSSSKFSLSSIRSKDTGLFGGKKGGSNAANSDRADRDASIDMGDDTPFGRSVESITSSPMLGGMTSGEWNRKDNQLPGTPKEGSRMSVNWSRFGLKKGKGRESLDVDRSEAETTGNEDEDS
ncbi:hypothetical protein BJ875DRAFT_390048 [Amylocarpus encephaloides]|uniref:Fibronectin type-III domain-containing protein n=1 Tax=Amylocarpus encephaloides TaxID=45428 RepID=A0A9P8BZ40_9HELO|nr:hypothetical protein BJ875DRAFT_390048 [Amylocarpus encephaloides]